VLRGDIKPMQQLLGTKGYDIQADAKSGNYLLRMPGSDAVQSIDKAGLLQLNAMATYRDQLAAREKAALDARKSKAEAGLKEAQVGTEEARAGYYSRMPQDRFSLSARGAGKGKGEGEYDPISTLEDFNKAIGNDPATGQPYAWAPTAAQHYQQIIDANPDLSGKQGGQYALNMAIALGKGQARAIPEIDANGNAKLVATWPGSDGKSSPRKVVLQSDIDMSDPAMVQGVGGNQAAQQQEWVKAQASAVQQFARSSPTDYRNAAMASGSEEGMATLAELAKKNPEAARAYNFAKHIRDLTKLQATVTQDPSKPAPTKEQKAVADALKLDVNDPGMLDRIRAAGNRFVGAISGVAKRAQEENIESQLRIFREYPNDRSVREWLYAKSQGNPELQKRILEIASPK
jgi:hypothetical protein